MKALKARELDMIQFDHGIPIQSLPTSGSTSRLVQAACSMGRAPSSSVDSSNAITSNARPFHTERMRLLLGKETFYINGIHFGADDSKLADFTDDMLTNLAGNSFHVWCAAAMFFATVVLHAVIHSKRADLARGDDVESDADTLDEIWQA